MVAEKIRDLIALELGRASDPRFALVTITSVIVSPDLRHAKVYWASSAGRERLAETENAFSRAEGMFKRTLSRELKIRFVPELKFYYDETLDTVDEVEKLFARVHEADKKGAADTQSQEISDEDPFPGEPQREK